MGSVQTRLKTATEGPGSAGAATSEDPLTDPLSSAGSATSTVASRVYGGGSSRGGGSGSRFGGDDAKTTPGTFGGGSSRGGGAGSRASDEAK